MNSVRALISGSHEQNTNIFRNRVAEIRQDATEVWHVLASIVRIWFRLVIKLGLNIANII